MGQRLTSQRRANSSGSIQFLLAVSMQLKRAEKRSGRGLPAWAGNAAVAAGSPHGSASSRRRLRSIAPLRLIPFRFQNETNTSRRPRGGLRCNPARERRESSAGKPPLRADRRPADAPTVDRDRVLSCRTGRRPGTSCDASLFLSPCTGFTSLFLPSSFLR